MSVLASQDVLRPVPRGIKGWLAAKALAASPFVFAVLRKFFPILRVGKLAVICRYDDVKTVFLNDSAFKTPYSEHIEILTGGEPFFLGMRDTLDYRAGVSAMRSVFLEDDLPMLGARAEAIAQVLVSDADGEIETVSFVREVTFRLFAHYIGIPEPEIGRLDVWCTRLFEFQFAGSPKDTALRSEVDEIAPALRSHIDAEIERRKADGSVKDDVLGRCLQLQAEPNIEFTDLFIRTHLLCMLVGGPPQPPMVVPQALEQLLRRPEVLSLAASVARSDDDLRLWKIVREAMRFDPLAPALPRLATDDVRLARGLSRQKKISEGTTVLTAFASAMMDSRRIPSPKTFNPERQDHEYIHFGLGLHECFGRLMNEATLHRILKPLLSREGLRRAPGDQGHLSKRGIFAERLYVCYKK